MDGEAMLRASRPPASGLPPKHGSSARSSFSSTVGQTSQKPEPGYSLDLTELNLHHHPPKSAPCVVCDLQPVGDYTTDFTSFNIIIQQLHTTLWRHMCHSRGGRSDLSAA